MSSLHGSFFPLQSADFPAVIRDAGSGWASSADSAGGRLRAAGRLGQAGFGLCKAAIVWPLRVFPWENGPRSPSLGSLFSATGRKEGSR